MEIHIVDYGMGNLRSIQKGLEKAGATATITSDVCLLKDAAAIVLPGVGAFEDAMKNLRDGGFVPLIHEKVADGAMFLGVCLGLQLLFDSSTEGGSFTGLRVLSGKVDRFPASIGEKIPHVGWNQLSFKDAGHFLLDGIEDGSHVYFVHSYHAITGDETIVTTTTYGYPFPSIVKNAAGNLVATQFHPEKSSVVGLSMLENFVRACKA